MSRGFVGVGRSGPRIGMVVPFSGRFFIWAAAALILPFGVLFDACQWVDDPSRSKLFGAAVLVLIAGLFIRDRWNRRRRD
jgi:hypothetical protein